MILPLDITVIEGQSIEFACSPFVPAAISTLQIQRPGESAFTTINSLSDNRLSVVMDYGAPNDPTNRTYSYSDVQRTEHGTQLSCTVNGVQAVDPATLTVYCELTSIPYI